MIKHKNEDSVDTETNTDTKMSPDMQQQRQHQPQLQPPMPKPIPITDNDKTNTTNTNSNTSNTSNTNTPRKAQPGDIVTIDLELRPENGFIPEPLFDTVGRISFMLGWGNYLPAIHELVEGCLPGDSVQNVLIDAGWGDKRQDMVFTVPLSKLPRTTAVDQWIPGQTTLTLQGGLNVLVTSVSDTSVVLDANPPLAGSSYSCSFTVQSVEPGFSPAASACARNSCSKRRRKAHRHMLSDSTVYNLSPMTLSPHYQVATFALGCFWGAELAFMRTPGVVGTRVGYAQQQDSNHIKRRREAVFVVYDQRVVSYTQLVQVAIDRLREMSLPYRPSQGQQQHASSANSNADSVEQDDEEVFDLSDLFREDNADDDDSYQYRIGIFYHSTDQQAAAAPILADRNNKRFGVELLPAQVFCEADDHHQQYLYKGGQTAKKGAKEKIRCFG